METPQSGPPDVPLSDLDSAKGIKAVPIDKPGPQTSCSQVPLKSSLKPPSDASPTPKGPKRTVVNPRDVKVPDAVVGEGSHRAVGVNGL